METACFVVKKHQRNHRSLLGLYAGLFFEKSHVELRAKDCLVKYRLQLEVLKALCLNCR